jgi:hypothetical protein
LINSAASYNQVDDIPVPTTVVKTKTDSKKLSEWLLGSDEDIDRNPREERQAVRKVKATKSLRQKEEML